MKAALKAEIPTYQKHKDRVKGDLHHHTAVIPRQMGGSYYFRIFVARFSPNLRDDLARNSLVEKAQIPTWPVPLLKENFRFSGVLSTSCGVIFNDLQSLLPDPRTHVHRCLSSDPHFHSGTHFPEPSQDLS